MALKIYCTKCKRECNHDEVRLKENSVTGDLIEVHNICGSKLKYTKA